ncbi:MAG: shikimate kinase [Pseudomonadota bacterium]|jgi:shikimate kinase
MNPSPNLFLVGPMAAGKSSLGRRIARRFGMAFVDLDAEIVARTGASVNLIFAHEGEPGFRRRESEALADLTARRGVVLATGGGSVLAEANRRLLRERGFVVWLRASVDQQLARTANDRSRPLLATPDRRGRLEALAHERDPLYAEVADLAFGGGREGAAPASQRLAAAIEQQWQREPPASAA